MKVLKKFEEYCNSQNISFTNIPSVKSYGNDTLFCIAGMQQYKDIFSGKKRSDVDIVCNSQSVLRCNDIDEISDNTHYLYFNMLGYFDFNQKNYERCVLFWLDFISDKLKLHVDSIEIHPYIMNGKKFNHQHFIGTEIMNRIDYITISDKLIWEDGDVKGYSTEFYIDGVEIGNIVLLENGMLDCGFGLERLESFYNPDYTKPTEMQILVDTAQKIIDLGFKPKSNGKQEYILWDIMKRIMKLGDPQTCTPEFLHLYNEVKSKYLENQKKYDDLKYKYLGKSKEWWKDTHGIYLD
jgi:alanyl-tRNA synthetase